MPINTNFSQDNIISFKAVVADTPDAGPIMWQKNICD